MDTIPDSARIQRMALAMLARREHSRRELKKKLLNKGCPEDIAEHVIADLEGRCYLSDERFSASLIRVRRERGYGPLRIQKELQEKGVDAELIERLLDVSAREWTDHLLRVRRKKFGNDPPGSYKERARQARFLQYRGFTHDQIRLVLDGNDETGIIEPYIID